MNHHAVDSYHNTRALPEDAGDVFIDITLECTRLASHQALFDRTNTQADQCGVFTDATGDQGRFKSWEASNPPTFHEGATYELSSVQLVRTDGEILLIIRSRTTATRVDGFETGTRPCPDCDTTLDESHIHHGPEAPEIGWEYIKCPACGTMARPPTVWPIPHH